MSEVKAIYTYQIPEQPDVVQVSVSRKWYAILRRLWQLENDGHQMAIIQFSQNGPQCREVGRLEK